MSALQRCPFYRDLTKIQFWTEFRLKKIFHTFLYEDCKWETRYLYTYKYSLTKNLLKNIYKLLLKYALIQNCFRLLSWKSSVLFVIVDNISWLSSSKTGHRFILSSVVIISSEPMLSWIIGQLPKNLTKIFHQFMKIPNCTIGCEVAGKRVYCEAGFDLEIPVQYRFIVCRKSSWTGRKKHEKSFWKHK